jgi:4-amino-4-deoxy-L-arabinose transferase-like glycosyltransferase
MTDVFKLVEFARKKIKIIDIIIAAVLIVLYLLTRLINLDKFPIFSDEGIYIHWAKVAWHDATWRFISLTDGKQPLQTWGTIPFLKLFSDNALLGGRLFAVSTGFVALIGIFVLLTYLFDKKTAIIGSFLYIFTPYFLFYDRMALVDSGVNASVIWILLFSIWLARSRRLDAALLFGIISGIGLLAKSSVKIFVGLAVFAPILFLEKNAKKFMRNVVNYGVLYAVGVVIAVVIYNVQRLSPFLHYVEEKNNTFVKSYAEFKAAPFDIVGRNLGLVPQYVLNESGYVLAILGVVGLIFLYRKHARLVIYLLVFILYPFVIVVFLSKVLFPRYIIFFATFLLIPAAYLIKNIKNKLLLGVIIVTYIISVGYYDFTIIADYAKIPFPPVDRGQYLEGWPAGWGMKEIIDIARAESKNKPVLVIAEGNFGLAADVLDVFLKKDDTISIKGYWPLDKPQLIENQPELDTKTVYIVLAHKFDYPSDWPMKLIKKYEKPGNQSVTYLYELTK